MMAAEERGEKTDIPHRALKDRSKPGQQARSRGEAPAEKTQQKSPRMGAERRHIMNNFIMDNFITLMVVFWGLGWLSKHSIDELRDLRQRIKRRRQSLLSFSSYRCSDDKQRESL